MAKRTTFEQYKDTYENFHLEMDDDGILLMRCHSDDGPLIWNADVHNDMADVFADIAGDAEVKVVIHTGTGENYNADWGFLAKGANVDTPAPTMGWAPSVEFMDNLSWFGRQMLNNLLDIDVPMISAINGPCNMHSEVPLLCDVVLASDTTWFDDGPHFPRGMVPGDGQHIMWPAIIGPTRAHYFLLTNERITAEKALEWGAVNEVHPQDALLERAYEIARDIARRPPMATRFTRRLFTQNWKRLMLDELSHGIALELYAQRQFYPVGGGMGPIQGTWDDADPFATS